ncbi:MAG TPA: ABC transporter permease [Bryobacteraceae bacterium]|nr:ABC transporter permease [Bryobacteraceae bacterium]
MRYAIRTLRRSPGFTVIALLTLALGMGANTAIFSFVNGVLLKPLPYRDPHGIVLVWEKPPGGSRNGVSTLNFLDWKNQNTVFEHMAAVNFGGSVTLTGSGRPEELQGARVSAAYFDIFGVQAALGRTFAADEDQLGKSQVVILSQRLWENRFGADPSIVGRTLHTIGSRRGLIRRGVAGLLYTRAPGCRGGSHDCATLRMTVGRRAALRRVALAEPILVHVGRDVQHAHVLETHLPQCAVGRADVGALHHWAATAI